MNSTIRALLTVGCSLVVSLVAPMAVSANSVSTLQNITPGIDNKNINGPSVNGGAPSSINADGSIIAYATFASNMVPNDTNRAADVFLYHTRTKQTEIIKFADPTRVNVSADISPNGRYVAIVSYEQVKSNGSITLVSDLFVHDRTTKQNIRANIDATGKRMDVQDEASMSNNGRVAFSSRTATGPLGTAQVDVMVVDTAAGTMRRASGAAIPGQYFYSREPKISADGRYVAFTSNRPHEDAPEQSLGQVYVSDLQTDNITLISRSEQGKLVNAHAEHPSLSDNGRHIAFVTIARLMSRDTDTYADVYQRDLDTGRLILVSETMKNVAAPQEGRSYEPSVSADGKYTAFASTGAVVRGNVKTPHEFFEQPDVFIYHRDFGMTRIVSQTVPLQDDAGRKVLYGNASPAISSDGKSIVFLTYAHEIYPDHSSVINLHLYHNPVVHIPYYDPGDILEMF